MKDLIMPSVFTGMLIAAVVAFATFSTSLSESVAGNGFGQTETTSAIFSLQ